MAENIWANSKLELAIEKSSSVHLRIRRPSTSFEHDSPLVPNGNIRNLLSNAGPLKFF